jgi:hypothetical protein
MGEEKRKSRRSIEAKSALIKGHFQPFSNTLQAIVGAGLTDPTNHPNKYSN